MASGHEMSARSIQWSGSRVTGSDRSSTTGDAV